MSEHNSSGVESDGKAAKEDAAARWRKLIEQQRQSELSVSAYCRERGVSAASFFAWRRRLAGVAGVAGFKAVKLRSPRPGAPRGEVRCAGDRDCVCRAGKHRLMVRRGFDRDLLIELIGALEAAP